MNVTNIKTNDCRFDVFLDENDIFLDDGATIYCRVCKYSLTKDKNVAFII